jgi:short-subunit dehydrogenase
MKTAVIFGASGGIGQAIADAMREQYRVIECNREHIDLSKLESDQEIKEFLDQYQPDVVINSAGVLGTNQDPHHVVMDVNFGTNWSISRYFIDRCPDRPIKIVMIGSTAYQGPRARYMLYAASKAAVYSLWQSLRDWIILKSADISVDLINPPRVRTSMSQGLSMDQALEPEDVAELVISRLQATDSVCIDMEYKESK